MTHPEKLTDSPATLVERAKAAIALASRMDARGQHPTNIYNIADELLASIDTLAAERDAYNAWADEIKVGVADLKSRLATAESALADAVKALEDIAGSDDIDNALDPERNKRVARAALWNCQP